MWRRSATAFGTYGSTALGVLGSVVAARLLGKDDFGRFAEVLATASFFQLLLDLTSEEALVKFGFRYSVRGDWGRFRRLLAVAAGFKTGSAIVSGVIVAALAPLANGIFGTYGLAVPMLVAAALPLLQSTEGLAASALILRSRYDIRAAFLMFGMALRLVAVALTASHGVLATIIGVTLAQAFSTASISAIGVIALRRFPSVPSQPLAADRPELLRFVAQSSIGTGIVSLRGWVAPLLLGLVRNPGQVGIFRAAQAPQQGLSALSSPVRLILLTEQTRDWERGDASAVFAGLRRYVLGATLAIGVALVPLELAMPWLVRLFLGSEYSPATSPARIILLAAAVQLVFGWTKSFPVSIGRPGLRIVAHSIETAVLIPFLLVLGSAYGATGAAGAVLIATGAFAVTWTVILLKLRKPLARAALRPPEPTGVAS